MIPCEIGHMEVRKAVSRGMCISVVLLFDNEFKLRGDKYVAETV